MKRLLAFLLCLFIAIPLFACGNGGDDGAVSEEMSPSSGSVPESEPEPEPEPEPVYYDVVFYRFYADEADVLAAKIKEKAGYEPQVIKYDDSKTMPEHAIYLGEVTDGVGSELCKSYRSRDYGVKAVEGSIYIFGGSHDSVREAIAYFGDTFVTGKGINAEECEYLYEHQYSMQDASVGGRPLSDYVIIYSPTDNEAKYANVAEKIKAYIHDNADVSVRTASSARAETECEIILGCRSGRELADMYHESDYDYNEYRVVVSGTKVAITGNNACAVWHGWEALCAAIIENGGEIGDTEIEDTCELIKVACVGDSITIGINSSDPYVYTYPNFLQEMLGYDYLVKNFGASGYSVVYTDDYAYCKHPFYKQSQQFAPDVVLWMLGTNDGNPGQDYKAWEGTKRDEKYIKSAEDMFAAYEGINPDVQIFVSIPATLFESTVWVQWEEWGRRIETYVIPLNYELAEKHGYPIIEMYSWSLDHVSVFPDGLHPKDNTYKTYAQRVYDEIKDVIKTPA